MSHSCTKVIGRRVIVFYIFELAYCVHGYIAFHNVLCIPTLTLTYLKYINILYETSFKFLITRQAHTNSSIFRYLKCGMKSFKNFELTSLSLYITSINITLIILDNCSLLNPGPANPNAFSVFYQNTLITFNSLASDEPTLSINKVLELYFLFLPIILT